MAIYSGTFVFYERLASAKLNSLASSLNSHIHDGTSGNKISFSNLAGNIAGSQIPDDTITGGMIGDNTITSSHIVGSLVNVAPVSIVTGTTNITTSINAYNTITDMSITLTTKGGPVLMIFNGTCFGGRNWEHGYFQLRVDTVSVKVFQAGDNDASYSCHIPVTGIYLETLSAGEHTIDVQWKINAGTIYQYGGTHQRTLMVIELVQ